MKRWVVLSLLIAGFSSPTWAQFQSIRVDKDLTYAYVPSGAGDTIPAVQVGLNGLCNAFIQSAAIGDSDTNGFVEAMGSFTEAEIEASVLGAVNRRASVGSGVHYRFTVAYPVTATLFYSVQRQGIVWWDNSLVYLTDVTGGYHVFYIDNTTAEGTVSVNLVPNHVYTMNAASSRNNLAWYNGQPEAWGVDFAHARLVATGRLQAYFNLGNFAGNACGLPVTIELRQGGAVVEQLQTTMNEHQMATVSTALRGDYEVFVKPAHWLARTAGTVTITDEGAELAVLGEYLNGDVDGDNEVGPSDFSFLSAAFGSVLGDFGYRPGADLDGDEEVGPSDFSILATNFGEVGD